MIAVTGIPTDARTHKRICDDCGVWVFLEASVTYHVSWGRFWKLTVWKAACLGCGEIHRGDMVQVIDER